MEHIYTIKVKRQCDPRGVYPSERRYSASTVFGLAWLHLAIAATALLLACLALINPSPSTLLTEEKTDHFQTHFLLKQIQNPSSVDRTSVSEDNLTKFIQNDDGREERKRMETILDEIDDEISGDSNETQIKAERLMQDDPNEDFIQETSGYPITLIIAPTLVAVGALAAGLAAILASRRWYVDHNIAWFFLSSIFATILSLTALCMMVTWIVSASENGLSFCDYFSDGNLFGKVKVVNDAEKSPHDGSVNQYNNETWFYIIKVPIHELKSRNIPLLGEEAKHDKTKKVLSINILIASFVEIIWSLLSLKIAWKGMRSDYPEDDSVDNNRRAPTVHVVTEIKGNNTKHLPKNTKILPPQPDLIEHYPKNNKIKKFFQSQQENGGFFLKTNQNDNGHLVVDANNTEVTEFPRRESSEEYRERMLNFLNRCTAGSLEQPESQTGVEPSPSEIGNATPTPTPTGDFNADRSYESVTLEKPKKMTSDRLSIESWGDVHEYPIYDQNTLDLNKIMMKFDRLRPETSTEVPTTSTKANNQNESDLETTKAEVNEPA